MSTRIHCRLPALLVALICLAALICLVLLSPAARAAGGPRGDSGGSGLGSGGSGLGGSSTTPTGPATTTTPTQTGSPAPVTVFSATVQSSGDGISVTATGSGMIGRRVRFSGVAPAGAAGASVVISYASAATRNRWRQATTATVAADGEFSATWKAAAAGQLSFTVTLPQGTQPTSEADGELSGEGSSALGAPTTAAGSQPPTLSTSPFAITIFKPAIATIYGPGLWGHHTACGERLRRATLGVASRTLKCGTKIALYYDGRELVVRVIDRGPFANHASWDLTEATAKALGITQTSTIGTLAASATQ